MKERLLIVIISFVSCFRQHVIADETSECVKILYDAIQSDQKMTYFGRIHAMFLENVLGHFPKYQVILSPMSMYQAGDVETCKATIYLSTYYEAPIPGSFIDDFSSTKRSVVWAGYNSWKLGHSRLKTLWGLNFKGLTKLESERRDEKGRPGFYRYYSYKGETFEKYGEWDVKDPARFHAAFEIAQFDLESESDAENVRSWSTHNTLDAPRLPYIIEKDNKWLIGDSPFSYAIESDRYLIFCDLLFDILKEKPRRTSGPRPALFRVEDVHAMIPLWQLFNLVDVLKKYSVPYVMTIIPIFTDPFGVEVHDVTNRFVPLTRDLVVREALDYAKRSGGRFFYHGVTHQYGKTRNPFSGVTGSDFEFWDRVHNRPIAEDDVHFILGRLEDGLQILELAGINFEGWVTPHYQASPLAYRLFSQLFTWTAGRHIYFPHRWKQYVPLPEGLAMDKSMTTGREQRYEYLADIEVSYDQSQLPNGQFYPYEIFGDIYGQRVIPENVGNVQAYLNEQVFRIQTVDGMIANLKRNRVLRDVWGSFFIHPFCISARENAGLGLFPGDVAEIERLIKAVRENGYEFIDIATWTKENTLPKRKPTIEVLLDEI
jgi:uncharacterized protein YdaL